MILVALINSKDLVFQEICDHRLSCFNNCNKAYFPSLYCSDIKTQDLDYNITMNGNVFTNFYKYPDPEYVKTHEIVFVKETEPVQKKETLEQGGE